MTRGGTGPSGATEGSGASWPPGGPGSSGPTGGPGASGLPGGAGGARRDPAIAIDGPAGAGKSTLARSLAHALGLAYVNTGLMYRAVAARALDQGIDPEDGERLELVARKLRFALREGEVPELSVDGRVPDDRLTSPQVERIVSAVARHPGVREVLRDVQRELGKDGCVMEGRDIGTVVLPDADVKIFLVAPPPVRAERRMLERGAGGQAPVVAEDVERRDALDAVTNPLVPAADAVVLDTTTLGRAEVLAEALRVVRDRLDAGER